MVASAPPRQSWHERTIECSSWFRIMSDDALQPSRACQPTLKPCLFVLTFTPFWRIGIGKEPYDFELNQSLKSGSNVISGLLNLQNKNVNIKNVCTIILESEHFNVAVTLYIISVPELPLTREWALMVHTELYKSHPFLFPLRKKVINTHCRNLRKLIKHNPCESHGWQYMPPPGRESGVTSSRSALFIQLSQKARVGWAEFQVRPGTTEQQSKWQQDLAQSIEYRGTTTTLTWRCKWISGPERRDPFCHGGLPLHDSFSVWGAGDKSRE